MICCICTYICAFIMFQEHFSSHKISFEAYLPIYIAQTNASVHSCTDFSCYPCNILIPFGLSMEYNLTPFSSAPSSSIVSTDHALLCGWMKIITSEWSQVVVFIHVPNLYGTAHDLLSVRSLSLRRWIAWWLLITMDHDFVLLISKSFM